MKNLFKLLLAGTFLFTFAAKSFSQKSDSSTTSKVQLTTEEKAVRAVNEMTKIATLSEDQITQIKPIVLEFFKQKEIDDAQFKGNEDALATAKKNRLSAYSIKIKAIVTDEQYTKLTDYLNNKNKQKQKEEVNTGKAK